MTQPKIDTPILQNYIRRWTRQEVSVPAKVEILLEDTGRKFTSGTAIVRNISLNGALLGRVVLKRQMLPARKFKIRLSFNLKSYKGIGALARPVHFGKGREFELGVEFEDLWIHSE